MTREQLNEKARRMLATRTMPQLLNDWDLTERMKISCEVAITRRWLMEEFERRDPEAFDAWMDADYDASPREFFKVA